MHIDTSRRRLVPSLFVFALAVAGSSCTPAKAPPENPASAFSGPRRGDPSPLVVVSVFSDYQCHACKGAHRQLRTLPAVFGEDVEIRYRQLPLTGIHRLAADAALFALAADAQGGFACFEAGLYARQREWSELEREAFVAVAESIANGCGLDAARLIADAASPALAEVVERDRRSATAAGATGTPTILVNGTPVRVAQTPARNVRERELLVPRIRAELRAARVELERGVPRAEIPALRALANTGDPERAAATLAAP